MPTIIGNIKGPQGNAGATGSSGSNGSNGTNGSSFLSGTGVPAAGLGNNGDTYLDISTGDLYKKTGGVW